MIVVSHMSVLQILSGYFTDKSWQEIGERSPHFLLFPRPANTPLVVEMPFPAGTVIQLTPNQYGWREEVIHL